MKDNRQGGRLRLAAALALLACLAAAGCGSYGSISGKLSYNGVPLGGGVVVFSVEGQGNASSDIGPDGSYHITKIPVGTAKIAVDTSSVMPPPVDFRRPASMPTAPPDQTPPGATQPAFGQPGQTRGKYVAIPENYADLTKSGLSYDVKSGAQTKDFDLK
jgi:hypothetical protein